jgi:hypothetical protein
MKFQALLLAAVTSISLVSFAHGGDWSNMTKDQRNKMADANEKMASCLRSDKSVKDCRVAFMDSCKSAGLDCGMKHHDRQSAMRNYKAKSSKSSSTESSGSSRKTR